MNRRSIETTRARRVPCAVISSASSRLLGVCVAPLCLIFHVESFRPTRLRRYCLLVQNISVLQSLGLAITAKQSRRSESGFKLAFSDQIGPLFSVSWQPEHF